MTGLSLPPKSIEWVGGLDGCARMIDQTRLPEELTFIDCRDVETMYDAIKRLCIRGAPAIGIAAAMGVVLGVRDASDKSREAFDKTLAGVCDTLASARPTAVNLFWALARMTRYAEAQDSAPAHQLAQMLLQEARRIRDEDAAMCRAIGTHGKHLIGEGHGVLTHCNAGALATAELGTALAPMYLAHADGVGFRVYADETRPLLQGSRLTSWELQQAGIDVTIACDNMAAVLMKQGLVNLVITGADRIAANGDAANKIGTYGLAVLAQAHDIPFYVAAPSTTFDFETETGDAIPIEQRDPDEVRRGFGKRTAPQDAACFCPAFDVTPAHYIKGIITERGLIEPVNENTMDRLLTPVGYP